MGTHLKCLGKVLSMTAHLFFYIELAKIIPLLSQNTNLIEATELGSQMRKPVFYICENKDAD